MGTPEPGIKGSITITAVQQGAGLLVSLASDGSYSDGDFPRLFYSISNLPPPDLTPRQFWGAIMDEIAGFFQNPE